jgi:MFS family permease
MVFTHLPSNIFLVLIPFMPTASSAVFMLFIRFSISQMDVPARQSYVALVVAPDERSAAGGITNIVRSVGLSISPLLVGLLLENQNNYWMFSAPFFIAGALKIVYDVLLYVAFQLSKADGDHVGKLSWFQSRAQQQQQQQQQRSTSSSSGSTLVTVEDELDEHQQNGHDDDTEEFSSNQSRPILAK